MNNAVETDRKWKPILYANYFQSFTEIANKYGYALAVHGSFTRDMDLIAVPWTEDAGDPLVLLSDICECIGRKPLSNLPYDSVGDKPHNRKAYTIATGGGSYLDISIMRKVE